MAERENGVVKWFDVKKGFGFIKREEGSDVFVHYSSIQGDDFRKLEEGQQVSFIISETDKGLQAQEVSLEES
ncbi:MAG: cold shock domain-containing protein [Calditrichia bacterium]|nr:cold shock domain-containing protein [Calditrichia bacterium]